MRVSRRAIATTSVNGPGFASLAASCLRAADECRVREPALLGEHRRIGFDRARVGWGLEVGDDEAAQIKTLFDRLHVGGREVAVAGNVVVGDVADLRVHVAGEAEHQHGDDRHQGEEPDRDREDLDSDGDAPA